MSLELFSADSHVIEEPSLWTQLLPSGQSGEDQLKRMHSRCRGRLDPLGRLAETEADGIYREVLYPTHGLKLFDLGDADLQEVCFMRYNDWLAEYVQVAPERLLGVAMISSYNMDNAVNELERCSELGLRGCEVWQTPHPDFPFWSNHYDRLWSAAQRLQMPVSIHILTGYKGGRAGLREEDKFIDPVEANVARYRDSSILKLLGISDALLELLFSGKLDQFPELSFVLVEYGIGWLPFLLQWWDYFADRYRNTHPTGMTKPPSEYFGTQIFATMTQQDAVGPKLLDWWGSDGCLWASDYPHSTTTWPHSVEMVKKELGHLKPEIRQKITRDTGMRLYGLS